MTRYQCQLVFENSKSQIKSLATEIERVNYVIKELSQKEEPLTRVGASIAARISLEKSLSFVSEVEEYVLIKKSLAEYLATGKVPVNKLAAEIVNYCKNPSDEEGFTQ